MIYTEQELHELIRPMIATAILQTPPSASAVTQITDAVVEIIKQDREAFTKKAPGSTSDGFHTFDELYQFRMLYNAAWFNTLSRGEKIIGNRFNLFKSWKHSDGEPCFGGGWFVVGAELPEVGQITNHYEKQHWDLFAVPEVAQAPVWDGHTAQMVADRLEEFLRGHHDKKR